MVFSSVRFFVFLAAILASTAMPMTHRSKKVLLCTASCLFYAAWDYRYLALLLLISVIDYWCAARIAATGSDTARRLWLGGSIASNLAILCYFKYANFFISNLNRFLPFTGHD